jgi:hypothetical protein
VKLETDANISGTTPTSARCSASPVRQSQGCGPTNVPASKCPNDGGQAKALCQIARKMSAPPGRSVSIRMGIVGGMLFSVKLARPVTPQGRSGGAQSLEAG